MCLRRIHRNLQKCVPSDGDIVSGTTLLNQRTDIPNLPAGMMKSFTGKDHAIEPVTACRLCLLHKHNVSCGMPLMAWIQSACKLAGIGFPLSSVRLHNADGACPCVAQPVRDARRFAPITSTRNFRRGDGVFIMRFLLFEALNQSFEMDSGPLLPWLCPRSAHNDLGLVYS
jgi:hypothetical protein